MSNFTNTFCRIKKLFTQEHDFDCPVYMTTIWYSGPISAVQRDSQTDGHEQIDLADHADHLFILVYIQYICISYKISVVSVWVEQTSCQLSLNDYPVNGIKIIKILNKH